MLMLKDYSRILFIVLDPAIATKINHQILLHIPSGDCTYINDDNIDMPQNKDLRLMTELLNLNSVEWKDGREYLHQACLGSGSIYFVWDKRPLIGRVVQDCVRPTHPVPFNPSFQWRQHNTRQHKHVSYIDVQCWALMVPMRTWHLPTAQTFQGDWILVFL